MAHVAQNISMFPTVVSAFNYVADSQLVNAIRNEQLVDEKYPYLARQSINIELQKEDQFQSLVDKILETTKEVCALYNYKYDSLEITNLWINFSKKGAMHNPHSHSNNVFSGVWYPFEEDSNTPIIFQDPRPSIGVLCPDIDGYNMYNSSLYQILPKKSMGLIFPSWLTHYVPPSANDRTSLSWNIILRGQYGVPNTLQNSRI
jgi:uncharacterized protein (TIGR02466 family)